MSKTKIGLGLAALGRPEYINIRDGNIPNRSEEAFMENASSVLNFAYKYNKKIDKISAKKIYGKDYPLKQSMNINLYKKAIK